MSKAVCFQPSLAQVISQNLDMFSELWNFKNLTVCFHFPRTTTKAEGWARVGLNVALTQLCAVEHGGVGPDDTIQNIYNPKILYHSTGWPNVSNKFTTTMLNDFESRCWIPLATIDPVLIFLVTQGSKHFRKFLIKWKTCACVHPCHWCSADHGTSFDYDSSFFCLKVEAQNQQPKKKVNNSNTSPSDY